MLLVAQEQMWSNSSSLVLELLAGIIRYVLSANLMISLSACSGRRSEAVTIYAAGPSDEPWTLTGQVVTFHLQI